MDWEVTVDGRPLNPRLDLRNHSPSGLAWGYSGSGPAQLALAILADCVGDEEAQKYYQYFKAAIIARLPKDEPWESTEEQVRDALQKVREARGE
jgi:hypothetical protein